MDGDILTSNDISSPPYIITINVQMFQQYNTHISVYYARPLYTYTDRGD